MDNSFTLHQKFLMTNIGDGGNHAIIILAFTLCSETIIATDNMYSPSYFDMFNNTISSIISKTEIQYYTYVVLF